MRGRTFLKVCSDVSMNRISMLAEVVEWEGRTGLVCAVRFAFIGGLERMGAVVTMVIMMQWLSGAYGHTKVRLSLCNFVMVSI